VEWVNAVVQGLLLGGIFAIAASGLALMFGVMRIANLAHGDLMVLAGYVAALTATRAGLPVVLSVLATTVVMGGLGYLLQRSMFDRALTKGEFAPLLVTFGISVIIPNALTQLFSNDSQPLRIGALGTASASVGPVTVGWFPLLTLVAAVALIGGLQLFLTRTQTGRIMRATADDAAVVRLMGVDNARVFAMATSIAFATVAVAGVFHTMRQGGVTPYEGQLLVLFTFETVVIGGLGSVWGALVGGMTLGVAQSVGAQIDPSLPLLVGHLVFLAVLVLRPHGLLGRKVPA
jgi:branched-chain amino acid transport system permease protein